MENLNFDSLISLEESFSNIKFFEKDHHYEINDEPALMSVSQLISRFEKPFDKDGIAQRVAKRDGKTINEVLDSWDLNRDYSCHKGSEFHFIVEQIFQRKNIPINKDSLIGFYEKLKFNDKTIQEYYNEMAVLVRNFKSFYNWWKQDHVLIKSEFVIGDKNTKICGMIDNLSFNKKTKELVLFDYKTNKEIKRKGFGDERMLSPIDTVPKCELGKYSLQLWLYKIIIEKNSPFKVGDNYIVWVAGEKDYELIPVINVKKEAELILYNI